MPPRGRAPLLATLYFTSLVGFLPASCERSSSERALSLDAAELLRDAPLYPPLRDTLYASTRNADPVDPVDTDPQSRNVETVDDAPYSENVNALATRNAETDDDTLYPHNIIQATRNAETDDSVYSQNANQASRDAENKVGDTLDKDVLGNDDILADTDTFELVDNSNDLTLALVDNPDNLDNPHETLQLQSDLDNGQSIDSKFQPFFDTEDESIEVIQTDPETSIEESGILVTPDETSLPDEKTNDIPINENYIATERLDVKEDILDNADRVEDLSKDARVDLRQEKEIIDDIPKDGRLDDSRQKGDRLDIQQKEGTIEDLLAKVEVEETEEYNREVNISEEVLKEILGGDEEDPERSKRSAGQDWDKSKTRRIKTGDTILNIRGAVRDAIGDAGAAPGPRASSRVDAFVIRPAPVMSDEPREQRESRREKPVQPQKREKELLVEPHASARLPCDVANVSSVRWYRDNEQMNLPTTPGADGVYRDGTTLVVGRATRHHAGRWRCTGRDGGGKAVSGEPTRVMIYEPVRSVYLAVDGRRLDAGNTWVPVRDRAELVVRCVAEGGVPPPELSWRLLALEPNLDHKPYLRANPTNYSVEGVAFSRVSLTAARELHNATLQCTARQRSPTAGAAGGELTAKLQIHVTYPPSFVISRWPGFGVALWAGGAAALRCDVDANPPARAAWTRHDRAPVSLAPVEEGGAGEAATLRWGALRSAHAGWYRCRARWADTDYYSIGYYLNVLASEEAPTTEAEPEPEPESQKVEVPLGGNVQLHCPKGSVGCWWRRVVGNASDSWAPAGSHHAHGVLGIKEAVYEEGGEYRCVGARAPDLQRLRELKRVTLAVTGGATATAISSESIAGGWRLTCAACGRNIRVVWVRGGRAVPAALVPDLAQHCWRAVLALPEADEVWCVVSASNGGAVAVFPRRTAPSPAPARHAVRALHAAGDVTGPLASLLAAALVCMHVVV